MGRQKSDDRVVPEGRRKASRAEASQQGKAVTVNKQAEQLGLFAGTAESPPGATPARPSSPLDEKRGAVDFCRRTGHHCGSRSRTHGRDGYWQAADHLRIL